MSVSTGRGLFVPKDATKREHVARIDRIVWASDDDTRVILALTDGASAIGPGSRKQFTGTDVFRFHGKWIESPNRGHQFHYDTFTRDAPSSRTGIVRYLAEICTGIGQKTAEALFSKYGPAAVATLRENPEVVAASGILSSIDAHSAAEDLERYKHLETTRVALFDLFSGRGFPGSLIDACITKWGVAGPAIIRRNPFALLVNKLPGCGFRRVDKLYIDLGYPADSIKRQALAGWDAIRNDRSGSTWLPAEQCIDTILELIPRRPGKSGADAKSEATRAMVLLRRAGWVRVRREEGKPFVGLKERADAERSVAAHVRRLNASSVANEWPDLVDDDVLSDHQKAEVLRATDRPLGILCGSPGTGKTTSAAALLQRVIKQFGEDAVRACAPTGKASSRLYESFRDRGVDVRSTTIHQLLEVQRNGHDGDGWGFARNKDFPLDCRVLVVDETSMCDGPLLASLLEACADGTHVLMLGDVFQLPPVGNGAPLRDLLASGVVPFGELTEVRRNAGSIVRGCAAIKAGMSVKFDAKIDIHADDPANLRVVDVPADAVASTVEDILRVMKSKLGFDPVWETQVITGLNEKGDASRVALNAKLGRLLNPDGVGARGNPFRVGDKIVCRRNAYLKSVAATVRNLHPSMAGNADAYLPKPFDLGDGVTVDEWYVANGEVGRVVAVSEKASVLRFGLLDTPLVEVKVGKKSDGDGGGGGGGAKTDDFELAWAITTHSAQGSEWPCVIVCVDPAAKSIADRNYHYTAISRAKKACILVGPKTVFEKQIKKQSMTRRKTFLVELLKDMTTA